MFKTLKARFIQGYRTGTFPKTEPTLPDRFQGRPIISSDATEADVVLAAGVCPVKAVLTVDGKLAIDTGRCLFCGRCAEVCPHITFSKQHRLATFTRESLLITAQSPAIPDDAPDPDFRKLCGKSFKIRQVSAGGCAACELDFNVLNTLAWDLGRFGIQVVASPRHADAILVTGPVTDNMKLALQKTFDAMAKPSWVIACGACAISGGIYAESPTTSSGVSAMLKPALYIPGCPPHPTTILEGLLRLMGR